MKRKEIISKLIKEGFSVKTLASLNDKQLNALSSRILKEQYNDDDNPVNIPKTDVDAITQAKQNDKQFVAYEGEMTEDKDKDDKKEESVSIRAIKHKIEHCKDKKKVKTYKTLLKRIEDGKVKASNVEIDEGIMDFDGSRIDKWAQDNRIDRNFNTTVTVDDPFTINFTSSEEYAKLTLILQKYRIPFRETEDGKVNADPIGQEIGEEETPKHKTKKDWLIAAGHIENPDKKDDDEDKKEDDKKVEAKESEYLNHNGVRGLSLKEWVDDMVGGNVHPFTSKDEIMNLIGEKLMEQDVDTMEPEVGVDSKLPDWLTYDAIMASGDAPQPAEPKIKPNIKPKPLTPKPDNPYELNPGIKTRPKAER